MANFAQFQNSTFSGGSFNALPLKNFCVLNLSFFYHTGSEIKKKQEENKLR